MTGPGYSRRTMVRLLTTAAAFVFGRPILAARDAPQQGRGIHLVLDETGPIIIQYRGQRVVLMPQEIMDALRPSKGVE